MNCRHRGHHLFLVLPVLLDQKGQGQLFQFALGSPYLTRTSGET